jgi:hypothetical protein
MPPGAAGRRGRRRTGAPHGAVGNFNACCSRRASRPSSAEAALALARAAAGPQASRERLTGCWACGARRPPSACPSGCPTCPPPARTARHRAHGDGAAARRAGARLGVPSRPRPQLGLTAAPASSTCWSWAWCATASNEAPTPARLGDRLRAAAVRLGRGPKRARAESVYRQALAPCRRDRHRTHAPRCAKPMAPTAAPGTSRATSATSCCRCAQRIAEENLLRYNGMLIGVFELLADARAQIAGVNGLHRGAARLLARAGRPRHGAGRPAAAGHAL